MVYGLESSCNGLVLVLADGLFEWSEVFIICFRRNGEKSGCLQGCVVGSVRARL